MTQRWVTVTVLLVAGVAAGVLIEHYARATGERGTSAPVIPHTTAAPIKYVCPMHPEVVQDAPGTCPICGMRLVAREPQEALSTPVVALSPAALAVLNVRTAKVKRATLWREAHLSAYIQNYSAGGSVPMTTPVAGRITALPAGTPGRVVRQGDVLIEIDGPALTNAQNEHLQRLTAGDAVELETSRQRLRALGAGEPEIARLEKTRTPQALRLRAPQDSQVATLAVHAGDTVEANTPLLTLETAGQAAADVEIYRSELLWMKTGDRAELRLPQTPGRVWPGAVIMEGALANPQRRTFIVRSRFPMPPGVVTGSMTGEVWIFGAARPQVLSVPRDALIRTGHESRVVLARGAGRFQPVTVTPGIESGEQVEIAAGLHEGDEVVVGAQFLIDSESSLRAEFQRLSPPPAGEHTHGHPPVDAAR